jgi:hypothetical protein
MSFTAVKLNDMPVPYLNTAKQLQLFIRLKGENEISFDTQQHLSRLCIS